MRDRCSHGPRAITHWAPIGCKIEEKTRIWPAGSDFTHPRADIIISPVGQAERRSNDYRPVSRWPPSHESQRAPPARQICVPHLGARAAIPADHGGTGRHGAASPQPYSAGAHRHCTGPAECVPPRAASRRAATAALGADALWRIMGAEKVAASSGDRATFCLRAPGDTDSFCSAPCW